MLVSPHYFILHNEPGVQGSWATIVEPTLLYDANLCACIELSEETSKEIYDLVLHDKIRPGLENLKVGRIDNLYFSDATMLELLRTRSAAFQG